MLWMGLLDPREERLRNTIVCVSVFFFVLFSHFDVSLSVHFVIEGGIATKKLVSYSMMFHRFESNLKQSSEAALKRI